MRLTKQIPLQIYLQAYDIEGNLLDATKNEVTWCVDQINENDAVYILAMPELVALLDGMIALAESTYVQIPASLQGPMLRMIDEARALAAEIRGALEVSE